MIFFRAGLMAALLIGLGAPGGPAWAQYDAPLYPPAPVSPSQPIPLDPDRALRDPVAPTDTTGSTVSIRVIAIRVIWRRCRPRCGPRPAPGRSCRRSSGARWSTTTARSRPARSSIRRTPISILCSARARRCATGLASAARASPGPARRKCRGRRNPNWNPPEQMIERQPYLPRFMAGGDGNPLGARALYLGDTIYRIHGQQPSTIGTFVSSGCIRLTNEDITDLHSRVKVGTRVVVLPGRGQSTAVTTGLGSSGGRRRATSHPPGVPSSSDLPAKRLTPAKRPAEPAQETPKRIVEGEANAIREPAAPASKGHQDAAGFEE